jgi:hypothetical protein
MKRFIAFAAVAIASGLILIAVVGLVNSDPNSNPKVRASQQALDDVYSKAMAGYAIKARERQLDAWDRRYGSDIAARLYRCQSEPPKLSANQEWCRKMLARAAKDDAAEEARQKEKAANW